MACFGSQGPAGAPQPPVLVSRITFPDLDGVADPQPGPLSSPSAATPLRQQEQQQQPPPQQHAWQFSSPQSVQTQLGQAAAPAVPQPLHTLPTSSPLQWTLSQLQQCQIQPDHEQPQPQQRLGWPAPFSSVHLPLSGSMQGCCSAAVSSFGAGQLGGSIVCSPPAVRTRLHQLADGGQGGTDCPAQLDEQSLAVEQLRVPPTQPPQQMPLQWMPQQLPLVQQQQQRRPDSLRQAGRLPWWPAAEAQGGSPAQHAGLPPLLAGSLSSQGQAGSGQFTAAAPSLAPVYCPHTGQLLRCREWLRQEEGRLYLHPCHQVVAWDSRCAAC